MHIKKLIKKSAKEIYLLFLLSFSFFMSLFNINKSSDKKEKIMLIVKLDAIGDYILFRNFLLEIKNSEEYKNYKLVFVGNVNVSSLATWLDCQYIDKFIFVDKRKFYYHPLCFIKFLIKLNNNYEVAIQPTFSRDIISDFIIKYSGAKKRIGFLGDINNISIKDKNISDKWYTELIDIENSNYFEFYKNKSFFEKVLDKRILFNRPLIVIKNTEDINCFSDKYVVIFPGAGQNFRCWSVNNWSHIASFCVKEFNLKVIIAGSEKDKYLGDKIKSLVPDNNFLNFCGKTDLKQLVLLISKADLLISNDTSAAHIGAATNTKTIVLSQFNHYGRFVPYPKSSQSSMFCITPETKLNFDELKNKFAFGSSVNIDLIKADIVEREINKIMA